MDVSPYLIYYIFQTDNKNINDNCNKLIRSRDIDINQTTPIRFHKIHFRDLNNKYAKDIVIYGCDKVDLWNYKLYCNINYFDQEDKEDENYIIYNLEFNQIVMYFPFIEMISLEVMYPIKIKNVGLNISREIKKNKKIINYDDKGNRKLNKESFLKVCLDVGKL